MAKNTGNEKLMDREDFMGEVCGAFGMRKMFFLGLFYGHN